MNDIIQIVAFIIASGFMAGAVWLIIGGESESKPINKIKKHKDTLINYIKKMNHPLK